MADGYRIHLIRHLPTKGNGERKYIGWTDEPIVESTQSFQCQIPVTSPVFGSDLLRARQTAAFYFPSVSYEADERWRECHFGRFEGKTYADLEEIQEYRNWIDDPYTNEPPEGESLSNVENRVLSALAQLPNEAVVVTHGGPIRLILVEFSVEKKEFWSWDIPHGAGYRLEWESGKAFREGRVCTSISVVHPTASGIM